MALGTVFLATLILGFALTLFLAGLFGAYFGEGRSRAVGFVLSLLALLSFGAFVAMTWPVVPGVERVFDPHLVAQGIVASLAATTGGLLGVAAFVLAVMRS